MHKQVLRLLAAALVTATPVAASAKAIVRDGFSLPNKRAAVIAVFRPDVEVGQLSVGGVAETSADWTANARKFLAQALAKSQKTQRHKIVMLGDPGPGQAEAYAQYRALFRAVSGAVMDHKMFPGNRLPTKKDRFDWTLGPGVSALAPMTGGADYGLFFYTYDQYGSDARKAAQIMGLLLGGGFMPAGVHIGYAGLVDMKSGDIVWFNTDVAMGGDVRTALGSEKRVEQLLRGFPGLPAVPVKR